MFKLVTELQDRKKKFWELQLEEPRSTVVNTYKPT